jgi:hypothetical protein
MSTPHLLTMLIPLFIYGSLVDEAIRRLRGI